MLLSPSLPHKLKVNALSDPIQIRLQRFNNPKIFQFLTHIQRGIEKEGLRVTPQAAMAQTRHPQALGSPLTHASITTDYSEALLEFITPVFNKIDDNIDYLSDLHKFTLHHLTDEYLWPTSMPCKLNGDKSIPIAQYGKSNIGQMKQVYRQGLAHRYGRTMQSIAGIHYNFSMPDGFWPHYQDILAVKGDVQAFKSQCYFDLIRNFRRHSWLLIYLFGASPTLDNSFVGTNKSHNLEQLGQQTLGLPYATSLRMSDLGYQSKAQENLDISYNNLHSYIQGVEQAMAQPYPDYEKIGIKVNGQYRQLNDNILQIENEYYSEIRPKRVTQSGQTPLAALKKHGVEYIEVRILDTNPYLPVGIDAEQIRFLDAFLLYCLLSDSPKLTSLENSEIKSNQDLVALTGRKPDLKLNKNGQSVDFTSAAQQLLSEIKPMSTLLDEAHGKTNTEFSTQSRAYADALSAQSNKVTDCELTPSAMVINTINSGSEFVDSMLTQAKKHHAYFKNTKLSSAASSQLQQASDESLRQQQTLEAKNEGSFEAFLVKTFT